MSPLTRRTLLIGVFALAAASLAATSPSSSRTSPVRAQLRVTKPHKMPPARFGTGQDGPLRVESGEFRTDAVHTGVLGSFPVGHASIDVESSEGFAAGDLVLLHQVRGSNRGDWMFNRVRDVQPFVLDLEVPTSAPFREGGDQVRYQAQVIRVPQYTDCYIGPDAVVTASRWNLEAGGFVALVCSGALTIDGRIVATGLGYNGGLHVHAADAECAFTGEGSTYGTLRAAKHVDGNGGGGGAGGPAGGCNTSGPAGGGGHGTRGGSSSQGIGGDVDGNDTFDGIIFGGGGGGPKSYDGDSLQSGVRGGNGGGAILIFARSVGGQGSIEADGSPAVGYTATTTEANRYTGGGGAGGGIFVTADSGDLGDVSVSAAGAPSVIPPDGLARNAGGAGGDGRIRIEYCQPIAFEGNPEPVRQRIDCSPPPTPTPIPSPTAIVRDPCAQQVELLPVTPAHGQILGPGDHATFVFRIAAPFTDVTLRLRDPDERLAARVVRSCLDAGTGTGRHIGVGTGRRDGADRVLEFNVGTETGTYFVDVTSGGSPGPYPWPVEIRLGIRTDAASRRTLVLTEQRKLIQEFGLQGTSPEILAWRAAVYSFAAHDAVRGNIVWDVSTDTNAAVAEAYRAWRAEPANPARADDVARALSAWLWDTIADGLTGIRYVVILGDDRIIPHQRLPIGVAADAADGQWQLEQRYADTDVLDRRSTVGSALLEGMTLSDDVYAAPIEAVGGEAYGLRVPILPVGRLVERPEQMTAVLASFLDHDGTLSVAHTLVAGYDFMEDGAAAADALYGAAGIRVSDRTQLLGAGWTAPRLLSALDRRLDLMTIAAHSTHFAHQGADGSAIRADALPASSEHYAGAIVASLACHGGLNAPGDVHREALDLPEAWQSRGAMLVGSTGWAYGLRGVMGYQELLITDTTARLVSGQGRAIGDALLSAKQTYFNTHELTRYDAKTLAGTVLFGLPMYRARIGASGAQVADWTARRPAAGAARASLAGADRLRTASTTALGEATQRISKTLVVNTADLQRIDLADGSHYRFGEHAPFASDGAPVVPTVTQDLGDIDRDGQRLALHGILFAGGRYVADPSFRVLTARAGAMDDAAPARASADPVATGPVVPVSLRRAYRTLPDGGAVPPAGGIWFAGQVVDGVHRLYSEIDTAEFYSDATDWEPPVILSVRPATRWGTDGRLDVTLAPGSGVRAVVATCDRFDGAWALYPLAAGRSWEWSGAVPAGAACVVQAVDAAGNVAADTNGGAYHRIRRAQSIAFLPFAWRQLAATGTALR